MNNYLGGFLLEENTCFVSEWCSDGTLYCLTTVCSPVGAEKYSSPREGQKGVFITSPPYSALLATDLYTMHYNTTSSTPSDKKPYASWKFPVLYCITWKCMQVLSGCVAYYTLNVSSSNWIPLFQMVLVDPCDRNGQNSSTSDKVTAALGL